ANYYLESSDIVQETDVIDSVSVFFFQAEDGIRDDLVTGVQTCALPISSAAEGGRRGNGASGLAGVLGSFFVVRRGKERHGSGRRSEERRVGKECRCRWSTHH